MIDVLIVGSGGAGLSAALHAKALGASVLVVSKTYPTHSQTSQAQGGMNAVLHENDSIEKHVEDTFKSSHVLGNKYVIQHMCENAKASIQWLDCLGVPFSRDENSNIAQRKMGGASYPRVCYSSDYTGLKILHTLYDTCLKESIDFLHEHMLLNFIVENQTAVGITALDIHTGEVKELLAKSVIVATGGYISLYNGFNTNSNATTGDGIAAAFRAGAKLSNMEFIQFHPTAIKGSNVLISESARGEGGYIVDEQGNRFVDELKPRDEVARAIYEKLKENEEVFLDVRHFGLEKINEIIPQERRLAMDFANVKLESELLSINPAAHYCMGGILVDKEAKTNIKNLYACGECSQSNVHGANRLGGNSLLEIITFGQIAAKSSVNGLKNEPEVTVTPTKQFLEDKTFIQSVFTFPNEISFYEKKEFMGKIFFKNIGLFRNEKNMKAVLAQLKQWQKEFALMGIGDKSTIFNKNLVEFIEFGNMLELSEVVVLNAMNRCESRGAHFRSDYPFEVQECAKKSVAYKYDGIVSVDFEEN